jgi:hypothetical protein
MRGLAWRIKASIRQAQRGNLEGNAAESRLPPPLGGVERNWHLWAQLVRKALAVG